ncbi:MAG TPA: hypothetical protein DCS87_05075 [Rheinheimera sp.]|nr:hypothetical protein [Rheinheimera sp.]
MYVFSEAPVYFSGRHTPLPSLVAAAPNQASTFEFQSDVVCFKALRCKLAMLFQHGRQAVICLTGAVLLPLRKPSH